MSDLAQSSPQKGKPILSNPSSSSSTQTVKLNQLPTILPGTTINATVLVSAAFPLKEISTPGYTGVILNSYIMDETTC